MWKRGKRICCNSLHRSSRGATLVEVTIAIIILAFMVGSVPAAVLANLHTQSRANEIRVAENLLSVGDSVGSGAGVLGASSDQVLVTVALPAQEQELLEVEDPVTVILPDGTEVAGKVTFVHAGFSRLSPAITNVPVMP